MPSSGGHPLHSCSGKGLRALGDTRIHSTGVRARPPTDSPSLGLLERARATTREPALANAGFHTAFYKPATVI